MPLALNADDAPSCVLNAFQASVRELIAKGFRVVPIPSMEKKPTGNGWPSLEISEDEISQHFRELGNVGVILGPNGLTDIDKDCEEAIRIAHMFLPETGLEFGRKSARCSHSVYFATRALATKTFRDPVMAKNQLKSTIIEIRGTKADGSLGAQSIFPPSVHQSGEQIEYEAKRDSVPSSVSAEALERAVSRIAAAVLIARHMPPIGGGRNECFLAIEGKLVRAGWKRDEVYKFSMAIRTILYDKNVDSNICNQMLDHAFSEMELVGRWSAFLSSKSRCPLRPFNQRDQRICGRAIEHYFSA